MSRGIERLNALKVTRTSKPGYYNDGGGLYLRVQASGAKSWVFRFRMSGRRRDMGLGPIHTIGLVDAREAARKLRAMLVEGVDPIEKRKEESQHKLAERKVDLTFETCAAQYIESHRKGWKSEKHAKQWESTLQKHAFPVVGPMLVRLIDTRHVLQVLEPIWAEKTETATRIRERIERVLAWSTVRGYRSGDNPARWKDHLDELLPEPSKLKKVVHYAALPYAQLPEFFAKLRKQTSLAARALELTILTASRSNEVLGAEVNEFSQIQLGEWVIPPERMKAGRTHRVALSKQAICLVDDLMSQTHRFIFPGAKRDRPLSNMAMAMLLRRMGMIDITVHGFRSTFRDWCAECTEFPREIAEVALAHTVGDSTENAYRRSDLFEKRRLLMQHWADFCMSFNAGEVARTGPSTSPSI